MSIAQALAELGCTSSINGEDPTTAAQYADEERVVIHSGNRPSWTAVKNKAAEIKLGNEVEKIRRVVQNHIDSVARSKNYDNGVSLSSYAVSTNPIWAAEAGAFVAWRDSVWSYVYAEMERMRAGERSVPAADEAVTELPEISWP